MILVDVNLLLYAYDTDCPQHRKARAWVEESLSGDEPVRLSWGAVLGFLRIATMSRGGRRLFQIADAVQVVDEWLEVPIVDVLEPGNRYWPILKRLLAATRAHGPLVMDVHLAALAIEHGATLCSADADFSRIPGLRFRNPLDA